MTAWRVTGELLLWGNTQLGEIDKVSVAAGEALPEGLSAARWPLAPMPGGDYAALTRSGMLGAERKRVDDLWASWRSGRLAEQLGIMLGEYDHVLLFIEDAPLLTFSESLLVEDDGDVLMQDLVTFQEKGVRLVFSSGLKSTHRLLKVLIGRYERTEHHALDRQGAEDRYVYRRMLLAVPGWGSKSATEALRAMGPPIKVFTAEPRELEAVKLVDKRKVRLLFGALGRAYGKVVNSRNWGKRAYRGKPV